MQNGDLTPSTAICRMIERVRLSSASLINPLSEAETRFDSTVPRLDLKFPKEETDTTYYYTFNSEYQHNFFLVK